MRSPFSFVQFKKLSFFMAALFLVVHAVLFGLFKKSGVTPMCYVNTGSVLFYCAMLYAVHRNRLHGFVVATFLEICLHMGLAEYYTGWNGDFQITLIGICILLFYAEYIGRSMHISYTPSLYLVPVAVLAYMIPSSVAELIRRLPPEITYCRWGGEAFLLAGKRNDGSPVSKLESLRAAVEAHPFRFEGASLYKTSRSARPGLPPGRALTSG